MTTTVIAMYHNADPAQKAINDLANAGCRREDIHLLSSGGGQNKDQIIDRLSKLEIDRGEAGLYAEAIQRGGALIACDAPDDKADQALQILNRYGARNLDNLQNELRQGQGGQQQGREEGQEMVPIVEEQVSVGKRRVLRGGFRVTSTVTERPVEESVRLREEKVDIERHPAERKLSPEEAEKAFQERSIEMTETAERPEVRKEARVVEEVGLRKSAEEHEEKVHETARRTDVKVEKVEPQAKSEGKK